MRNLLNPDNPVMNFITRVVYAVWLNILWFVCSIPIVTAGASTTALFYVTLKMVKNEEKYVKMNTELNMMHNSFWDNIKSKNNIFS